MVEGLESFLLPTEMGTGCTGGACFDGKQGQMGK